MMRLMRLASFLIILFAYFASAKGSEVIKISLSGRQHRGFPSVRQHDRRYNLLLNKTGDNIVEKRLRDVSEVTKSISDLKSKCPIIVKVPVDIRIFVWSTPVAVNRNEKERVIGRTGRSVCIDFSDGKVKQNNPIKMFSCDPKIIDYNLSVQGLVNSTLNLGKRYSVTSSTKNPTYFYYTFGEEENVFLNVSSDSSHCMLVAVREPRCPIFQAEVGLPYLDGYWQSVTTKSGMFIKKSRFPNGFFVVFATLLDDKKCHPFFSGLSDIRDVTDIYLKSRLKPVEFTITRAMSPPDYIYRLLAPLIFFVVLISIVFLIFWKFHKMRCDMAVLNEQAEFFYCRNHTSFWSSCFSGRVMSDLAEGVDLEALVKRSRHYYWSILILSSFYVVPVFQLLFNYTQFLHRTGEFDLCYYNTLCAHPYKMLPDFNHIYSNIGYVICGITFIVIVRIRELSFVKNFGQTSLHPDDKLYYKGWLKKMFPKSDGRVNRGVIVHYGLFYATGVSLIMTGIMSAAYHICPNQTNFQFDTSFMYIIAALSIVTIFQFRHPVYVSANMTFVTLSLVSCSTVFGLLWDHIIVRIIFTTLHIVFLCSIIVYLYYVGYLEENRTPITKWKKIYAMVFQKLKEDFKTTVTLRREAVWTTAGHGSNFNPGGGQSRHVLPFLGILANAFALLVVWTILRNMNFATQVLVIYVSNSAFFSMYYGFMKYIHKEGRGILWLQPVIHASVSAGLWAFSLFYFGEVVANWEKSPAESRAQNMDCILFNFYDSHDLWHFISAAALFCSLMVILTFDDDLVGVPQSSIPVF